MPTRTLPSPTTGKSVEAEVIDIEEIRDKPIMVRLADGSILRLRMDIAEVVRFKDEWDKEGHPVYNVKTANIVIVSESPDNLKGSR